MRAELEDFRNAREIEAEETESLTKLNVELGARLTAKGSEINDAFAAMTMAWNAEVKTTELILEP